jgi:hypothetical protein
MTSSFIRFFAGFGAFFSSRYSLGLEILALRQQLSVLKRKILALDCESRIAYSGFCCADYGRNGTKPSSSSNLKPLLPGIVLVFVCSGAFDRGQRALAGQSSMPRFGASSAAWRTRIPRGVLREFMENF